MDEDGLRRRYLLPGHKKGKDGRGENLGGLILYYVYFPRNSILAQSAVDGFPRNTQSLAEFHYYVFSYYASSFAAVCANVFSPFYNPLDSRKFFARKKRRKQQRDLQEASRMKNETMVSQLQGRVSTGGELLKEGFCFLKKSTVQTRNPTTTRTDFVQ